MHRLESPDSIFPSPQSSPRKRGEEEEGVYSREPSILAPLRRERIEVRDEGDLFQCPIDHLQLPITPARKTVVMSHHQECLVAVARQFQ